MSLPVLLSRRMALAYMNQSMKSSFSTSKAAGAYWNHEWRPNTQVPKTLEEKRAAAKKYGMILEDYETYPDDGTGYGDYPKLPPISGEHRDPSALYDMPELKRNYGEPLHIDCDMYGEDRYNVNLRLQVPIEKQAAIFVGFIGLMAFLFWVGEHIRYAGLRMMPKQKPYEGVTHYTFELD